MLVLLLLGVVGIRLPAMRSVPRPQLQHDTVRRLWVDEYLWSAHADQPDAAFLKGSNAGIQVVNLEGDHLYAFAAGGE